ncbi:MAG TPA: hypothetical protein VMN39_02900 [Longimicrobiaceae bacterium]|nr:hypothetical protein [Longimicrobiaceae bacterium]
MRTLRFLMVGFTLLTAAACTDASVTAPNVPPPPCNGTTAGSGC